MDAIAVRIVSPLVAQHRLSIPLRFPYPNAQFKDAGNNYASETKHTTNVDKRSSGYILLHRQLDECNYYVQASWKQNAAFAIKVAHYILISPSGTDNVLKQHFFFLLLMMEQKSRHLPKQKKIIIKNGAPSGKAAALLILLAALIRALPN